MDGLTPHFSAWRTLQSGNREITDALVRDGSRGPIPALARALEEWDGAWYWADPGETRLILVRAVGGTSPRWWLHIGLLILTLICTMGAGAVLNGAWSPVTGNTLLSQVVAATRYFSDVATGDWRLLLSGWSFAVPLLAILLVHELGHYLTARRYAIDVTPPFFIPVPPSLSPVGSLGAFIRLRSPVLDRRQLLDVGAAGPLAGFVIAVLVLAWGYSISERIPIVVGADPSYVTLAGYPVFLGESLLTGWLRDLVLPGTAAVHLSPPAFAGWVGMLLTGLNLVPLSQLDGGHIAYGLLGRGQRWVAWAAVVGLVYLAQGAPGWYAWLGLAFLVGGGRVTHPPVIIGSGRLPASRRLVGVACLALLVLCLMPRPFG